MTVQKTFLPVLVALPLAFLSSANGATVVALYGTPGTAAANPVTSTSNQAGAISGLTVTNLTGSGMNSNGTQFSIRDNFPGGVFVTGSSPTGAGTTGGSQWINNTTGSWGAISLTPVSSAHYYQFSLTSSAGNLALDKLTFDWQTGINNSNLSGNFSYQVFYSVDGGVNFTAIGSQGTKAVGNQLGIGTTVTDWGTITNESIDLTGIPDSTSVFFRIAEGTDLNSGATGNLGQFFQNIQLTTVPEPGAWVSLLGGMGILMGLCRRRSMA
jgi:hypothetical protein